MIKILKHLWMVTIVWGLMLPLSAADNDNMEGADILLDWKGRAVIEVEQEPEEGVVQFGVTPEVFDGAQKRLADLRVLAGKTELPWVLRRPRETRHREKINCELYNRTNIPGQMDRVMVKFEEKVLKDTLKIVTSGNNFKRLVTVEGSQDGSGWEILQHGRFLFDISTEAGGRHRKDRISLPNNNFRYLRITVHHDPDDPEKISIVDVQNYRTVVEAAPVRDIPVEDVSSEVDKDGNRTIVNVDFGYRNLPLRTMKLDFDEQNFHRHVIIRGRNRVNREVRRPMESGRERSRTIEEPWRTVGRTNVYRYSSGGASDESLDIDLRGERYRYIQLEIHNGDNPPLTLADVSADRYVTYVAFQPRESGPWRLYFGNPEASEPQYDLPHYVGRLRAEGVTEAELSDVREWSVEDSAEVPLSEHYRWVLWIVLLMAVTSVGWMVWRQLQLASRRQENR